MLLIHVNQFCCANALLQQHFAHHAHILDITVSARRNDGCDAHTRGPACTCIALCFCVVGVCMYEVDVCVCSGGEAEGDRCKTRAKMQLSQTCTCLCLVCLSGVCMRVLGVCVYVDCCCFSLAFSRSRFFLCLSVFSLPCLPLFQFFPFRFFFSLFFCLSVFISLVQVNN